MALDRLSPADTEILRLEGPTTCGHTCKVLLLDPSAEHPLPTVETLRAHIAARLDAAPRLRRRLVDTPLGVAGPVWLDDPQFDLARHVTSVAGGVAVEREALRHLVAELMTQHLDRSHPLWHLGLARVTDGSLALIWRIHHSLADGASCVRLGASVLWSETRDYDASPASAWTPQSGPGPFGLLASGVAERARASFQRMRGEPQRLRSLPASPRVLRRELSPRASLTPFARRVGSHRRVAFARASLWHCKRAAKSIDPSVTLNDVVLAVVAGGVRAWLLRNGSPTEGVRVKVPVSLHHADEGDSVANRDSYFVVDLPVDEADPTRRVLKINRETSERKADHDAETLDEWGHHAVFGHLAESPRVFTFNVSNVRGPSRDIYVCGASVSELYSIAEVSSHHALRVAVISAGGTVFFGLCADREAVDDLDVLASGICEATDELVRSTG